MRHCFREATRKKIVAFIQPYMLDPVKEALMNMGLQATTTEVRGFGRTRGHRTDCAPGLVRYVRKVKLELVVPRELVEGVLSAIAKTARTGNVGDGKVFVSRVDDTVAIGDTDEPDGCSQPATRRREST